MPLHYYHVISKPIKIDQIYMAHNHVKLTQVENIIPW